MGRAPGGRTSWSGPTVARAGRASGVGGPPRRPPASPGPGPSHHGRRASGAGTRDFEYGTSGLVSSRRPGPPDAPAAEGAGAPSAAEAP